MVITVYITSVQHRFFQIKKNIFCMLHLTFEWFTLMIQRRMAAASAFIAERTSYLLCPSGWLISLKTCMVLLVCKKNQQNGHCEINSRKCYKFGDWFISLMWRTSVQVFVHQHLHTLNKHRTHEPGSDSCDFRRRNRVKPNPSNMIQM